MVSFDAERTDLVPGYSGPRHIFENMGLSEGDIFVNKKGITLIIQPTTNEDILRVQAMEETELEKITEDILKMISG